MIDRWNGDTLSNYYNDAHHKNHDVKGSKHGKVIHPYNEYGGGG